MLYVRKKIKQYALVLFAHLLKPGFYFFNVFSDVRLKSVRTAYVAAAVCKEVIDIIISASAQLINALSDIFLRNLVLNIGEQ